MSAAPPPFVPHAWLAGAHRQTLATQWPRPAARRAAAQDEPLHFALEPGSQLRGLARWHAQRASAPMLVLVHGLGGSADSLYMLGLAHKAHARGFSVLRLNLRNAGGTEHLTPELDHAARTPDLAAVVHALRAEHGVRALVLCGWSLGGGMLLRLLGEWGRAVPEHVLGAAAISPPIELGLAADALDLRAQNALYRRYFRRALELRLRAKARLYPGDYDLSLLPRKPSIRAFDDAYTARAAGHRNAHEYYAAASARPLLARIELPTLIVQAQDDPLIPFASFEHAPLRTHRCVRLLSPRHGGHCSFLATRPALVGERSDLDRRWAEARALDFLEQLALRAR